MNMFPQARASLGATANRAPSPDFSSLSTDELERLEIVLQRQVRIEHEQNQRLSGLRRTMVHLQQTIHYDQQRQSTVSTSSSSSLQHQQSVVSSEPMQCYICYSTMEMPSTGFLSSPPIQCADCHRPICRRCGNYTSPELVPYGTCLENPVPASKWRCRVCIVRREVVRKSGKCLRRSREEETN